MNTKSTRMTYVVLFFVCVIAVAAYANHWRRVHAFKPEKLAATFLHQPRKISPFVLQDGDGYPFTNATLKGHWTLLFFGFTHCGYICPTTMATLAKTYDMMQEAHVKYIPEVVFVSIDPARDSAEKVKEYAISFNPQFKAARGDDDAVKNFAKEMAVVYMRVEKDKNKAANYDINHSSTVLLINPEGQLQAFFTPPHIPEQIAKEFSIISKHLKHLQ